ncbi:SDR family oxidoreductase, partial [Campylobacter coli]
IINEISINYIAQINLVKSSLQYLKETKGHILLFTSSSYTRGRALYSIYSSSKAAIVNFTQAIAEECSDFDVKINVINPQRTATDMRFKAFGKEDPDTLLDPKVVAKAAIDTLKSNLTGQVIDVRKIK